MVGETMFVGTMKKAKRPGAGARYTRISTVRSTSRACPPPPLGIIVDQQHYCRYSRTAWCERPYLLAAWRRPRGRERVARYTRISTVRSTSRACPPPPLGIIVDQQHYCRYSRSAWWERPYLLAAWRRPRGRERVARYTRISTVRPTSRAGPPPPLSNSRSATLAELHGGKDHICWRLWRRPRGRELAARYTRISTVRPASRACPPPPLGNSRSATLAELHGGRDHICWQHEECQEAGSWRPDTQGFPQYPGLKSLPPTSTR